MEIPVPIRPSIQNPTSQRISRMKTRANSKGKARLIRILQVNSSSMTNCRRCRARSEICQRHLTRLQEMLRTENRWCKRWLHDHKNSYSGRNQAILAKATLHKNQCSSWWYVMKSMANNLQTSPLKRSKSPKIKASQIGQIRATKKLTT